MDASCRTPLVQRQELAEHRSRQNLTRAAYSHNHGDLAELSSHFRRLEDIVMELREDSKCTKRGIPDEVSNLPTKARMIWVQLGKSVWGFKLHLPFLVQLDEIRLEKYASRA